jgi:hypothetical protein
MVFEEGYWKYFTKEIIFIDERKKIVFDLFNKTFENHKETCRKFIFTRPDV